MGHWYTGSERHSYLRLLEERQIDDSDGVEVQMSCLNEQLAVFISDVDLAVGDQGGTPDVRQHVVLPQDLAGGGVETGDSAGVVRGENEPGGDRRGADRAIEIGVLPDDGLLPIY